MKFAFPGYSVWVRAWQAQVGRATLYLLDTNDPANPPFHRGITSELYGGEPETRLLQEIVLGVGGWRLLRKLGFRRKSVISTKDTQPWPCLNGRARSWKRPGNPLKLHWPQLARAIFSPRTQRCPQDSNRFPPELITKYCRPYAENELKISLVDLLSLGRENPNDDNEQFNMAHLALRGSGAVNGVSRLHGEVSRDLFQSFFSALAA